MNPDTLSRIDADIQWLTKDLGPRPAFSSEARLAALGVRDRLKEAGWRPEFIHSPNNLVTCSGKGSVLLLAHTDTVPGSPGTLDNAVAVATLIEVARSHRGADLCIGFPSQEEIGLLGSTHLAEQIQKWHPNHNQLQLVISLDLVGHGTLSVTGLSKNWDDSALHNLLDSNNIYSEYGYQVVSRLLPTMERSDHRPFAQVGFRSAQLLGRNKHGITPNYHLKNDIVYDPDSVKELLFAIETIVETDWSDTTTNPIQTSAALGSFILPWWVIWPLIISAVLLGIRRFYNDGIHVTSALLALVGSLCIAVIACLPTLLNFLPIHEQEVAIYQLYGLEPNGWWMGALLVLPIILLMGVLIHFKGWLKGNSVGWFGISTLGLSIVDPILALPWAVGTLLSAFHPLLGMVGISYWLQPDILRELTTHGLLLPSMWWLFGLLVFPALLSKTSANNQPANTA